MAKKPLNHENSVISKRSAATSRPSPWPAPTAASSATTSPSKLELLRTSLLAGHDINSRRSAAATPIEMFDQIEIDRVERGRNLAIKSKSENGPAQQGSTRCSKGTDPVKKEVRNMKNPPFHERRRQQFLDEKLYEKTRENQILLIEVEQKNKEVADSAHENSSVHRSLYLEAFWIWMLDYTAGVPIDELAPRISSIVDAFEAWNDVDQTLQQEAALEFPDYGPYEYVAAPDFSTLADYENTLQLLSVAILLRDHRSIKRMIHIMRSHRGEDGLFEQLIGGYIEDEMALSSCVFGDPYDILLQVFYEEDEQKTLDLLRQYLKQWYPAMKDHPRWYDEHLKINKEGYAGYYGYWAFEAAAAVYILDLDDRQIDHLVYPKDLVDYARKLREEDRYTRLETETSTQSARIEGGQPCPQTGFWETPAKTSSRSHFTRGDIMPVFEDSEYGYTIWQWSEEQ